MLSSRQISRLSMSRERIVIIGSGWAGYTLAHGLDDKRYDITVLSPAATLAYTPLLASAACGLFSLSCAEESIRRRSKSVRYVKAIVNDVEFENRKCLCSPAFDEPSTRDFDYPYDRLIIAPGCTTQTFGTKGVEEYAHFVKTVPDASAVRKRLEDMFEMASLPGMTEKEQKALLHIIVVGGGPTGVEIAAELYDLIQGDLGELFPHLKGKATIALHDVADKILPVFDQKLAEHAMSSFSLRGIDVKTGSHITSVESGVMNTKEDGAIPYGILIWATGNKQVPLVDKLDAAKSDKLPRLLTNDALHVLRKDGSAMENVYAMGDAADIKGGSLPTTAEVATQKAEYLAKILNGKLSPGTTFTYKQKAAIAYIGKGDGVVSGKEDWEGAAAWLAWRSKNISWAKSWRSKTLIVFSWALNYLFGKEVAPR